jgi:hypothetical protein
MKPPLSAFFVVLAKEENIPAIMFNNSNSEVLPDDQVRASMREGNPEAFTELQNQMQIKNAPIPEGFLNMPPEEQPMIEEPPVIEEQLIDEEGGMI